jgi:hypothetical protein
MRNAHGFHDNIALHKTPTQAYIHKQQRADEERFTSPD